MGVTAALSLLWIGSGGLDEDSCRDCNLGNLALGTALLGTVLGLGGAVIGGIIPKPSSNQ